MANKNPKKENLKSNSERTPNERKKLARKAGIKSGEARRAKKTMQEMLKYLLEQELTNAKGEKATTLEVIMTAQIKEAAKGNTKAAQFIRDTIGEAPNINLNFSDNLSINVIKKEE